MTEITEIIADRRSIRRYKPDVPVTREQMDRLLHAAMLAPSARNSRPWEFIAVTKRELLDKIADVHPYAQMSKTATAAIVIVALPQEGQMEGYFAQDCGAATQNILLEAVAMGLGTCWCGVYPREERMPSIAEIFDIKAPKIPYCVITVGTPDENPSPRGFFEAEKVQYID
ncbi:MAG: nitroreductase family protein [Oscillospiraceae bacterium]|jgi:nitroreductase|nr:nitroreductase family protein [Oscillospiraceae bacterium]